MTPDRHAVATALLAAQCPAGVCARDVDQLDRALRGRLYLQASNLLANPFGLLDALGIERGLEVTQASDPYSFIVGGITVHNFSGDPDFSDDPRRDWLWGYYLVGSDWTAGFATMMDAARAGRAAVLGVTR